MPVVLFRPPSFQSWSSWICHYISYSILFLISFLTFIECKKMYRVSRLYVAILILYRCCYHYSLAERNVEMRERERKNVECFRGVYNLMLLLLLFFGNIYTKVNYTSFKWNHPIFNILYKKNISIYLCSKKYY